MIPEDKIDSFVTTDFDKLNPFRTQHCADTLQYCTGTFIAIVDDKGRNGSVVYMTCTGVKRDRKVSYLHSLECVRFNGLCAVNVCPSYQKVAYSSVLYW